jgi:hypothetical protein
MGMSLGDDDDGSKFKVGGHVTEAGHVSGTIVKLHTENACEQGGSSVRDHGRQNGSYELF